MPEKRSATMRGLPELTVGDQRSAAPPVGAWEEGCSGLVNDNPYSVPTSPLRSEWLVTALRPANNFIYCGRYAARWEYPDWGESACLH